MSHKRAWILFWLLGLIWGSSYLLIRIGVEQLNPLELVFIRTGIAAVGLNIVIYAQGKRLPSDWPTIRALILIGIGNTVIPFVLISWGETRVESGLASVLQATSSLFTLIIAHFAFTDDRITRRKIVGLLIGFVGVIILASRSWKDGQIATSDLIGQLAIVVASLFYATFTTYSRKVLRSNTEPIVVATGALTTAALIMAVLTFAAPLFGGPSPTPLAALRPDVLAAVLTLGVLNTFIAYTFYYSIVHALGASRASMVTYVLPPVGLTLGALILSEVVDFRLVLGAILIVGGIAIVNLRFGELFKRQAAQAEVAQDAVH